MAVLGCAGPKHTSQTILSPNNKVELKFELQNGQPFYSVLFKNQQIVLPSVLGFEFKNQPPLNSGFKVDAIETSASNDTWERVWGETKIVEDNYTQLEVVLKETLELKRKLKITFRVYDDGIGFRYEFPMQSESDSIFITNELTQFKLSEDYTCWYIPANFESYEMLYTKARLSQLESANTPITMQDGNGLCLSIHEANLTNYAGMTLKKKEGANTSFECDLVPWPDGDKVKAKGKVVTPWRTIQISENAAGLLESDLIVNLNEPNKFDDVSWIKPLKYVGVWWGMHIGTQTWTMGDRHGATTEEMKKIIDFASEHNIQGVLAEGWNTGWENWGEPKAFDQTTPYSDFNLEEIANYAKSHGVYFMGHHETGGDAAYYEERIDEAFTLYQSLGVHHVKTGYAGPIQPKGQYHHGQFMVNHYRKVVETAAEYKITINAHEPIKATGIRRTYPNMMSREGARGMEWNGWSEGNPPEHHVILPFTRNIGGPIDYTPGIFDIQYKNTGKRVKWNAQDKGTSRVNTTLSKQLALYVVFYSPLQMASDLIENYEGNSAFKFIEDIPVNWENTKVLNAEIGEFVTIVRKDINSRDWYLGSITNSKAREFTFKLDFLDEGTNYMAEIYADKKNSDWKTNPYDYTIKKFEVSSISELKVELASGGGQAIRFRCLD